MKKQLNKIILNIFFLMLISSCHTISHNDFTSNPANKNIINKQIEDKDTNNKNIILSFKKIELSKKIEIKVPKKLSKPSTFSPIKKIRKEKFDVISILNLSEANLLKELGESDFVKIEGKLKNHQYYFSKCFLDVFVIKEKHSYNVNFVETRSIKLNGELDKEECLKDIYKKINVLKN